MSDRRASKREQAQERLTTATTMYRQMEMRFWREKAEAEMSELGQGARVLAARTAPGRSPMTTRLYYLWFMTVIMAFMLEFLTPRVLALLPPY